MLFRAINKYSDTTLRMRSVMLLILLFFVNQSILSQIKIEGGVLEIDRTFYSDTTYIIYPELIVPDGIKLTIEPGTRLRFNYGTELVIDNGTLIVKGNETDSVYFEANHNNPGQFWKWNGITFRNNVGENQSYLAYAHITEAETGISIENSKNIVVEASSTLYCQDLGLNIHNSSYCYIVDCIIEDNYNGIEFYSEFLGTTSENLIQNTKIRNENRNINIFKEEGGLFRKNTITDNLIADGNNGIWIDNSGGPGASDNIISRNIIINNGSDVGYGLFLGNDSTTVSHNIFYNNYVGLLCEGSGTNSFIINNSFYKNENALALGFGSEGNTIRNNTFSENVVETFGFKEVEDIVFTQNNLMNTSNKHEIVVNYSPNNIAINNNYWGTTSAIDINRLIFDRNDNPALGSVYYVPYLTASDTVNPISPPYKVIKQVVNDMVRLSWHANEEEDIRTYNVHYGDFLDYQFSNRQNAGNELSYYLVGDISIYDELAVTAMDYYTNTNDQLTGHESPFAFAQLYPYAGKDTVICKYVERIKFTEANIPYQYDAIYWTTSGDGLFVDSTILTPTYYPGVYDLENGGTTIYANVVSGADTLIDGFRLRIIDDPIAVAGNDTTIIADTSIYLEYAHAQNFSSLMWTTDGDGVFDNDTIINPTYTPGASDTELGSVVLQLIVISECGSASDSLKITIEPHFSIEGRLWTNQKLPYNGVVVAFNSNESGTRAVLKETTKVDGSFRFPKVMMGNYYLYALPDTNNLENSAPGYYANKLRWQTAYLLPVDANVFDVDIFLPTLDFVLPEGEGSLSGHMLLPSISSISQEIYCDPWFTYSPKDFCNGGLSNNTVLLFSSDKSKLLDYTLTDEFGNFFFNDLPYGSYVVDGEKAGYLTSPTNIITLSPENPEETGIILEISDFKMEFVFDQSNDNKYSIIEVYPNPTSNTLNIHFADDELYQVSVYDIYGNIVKQYTEVTVDKKIILDIRSIPHGLYVGKAISSNTSYQFRFIIR